VTRYSQWCIEDHVLCCLCFGCFPLTALWRDPDGMLTDVCVPCQTNEAYAMNRRYDNPSPQRH